MLDKIKKFISKINNLVFFKSNNLRKLKNIKEAKIIFSCLENKDQEIVKFVGGCVKKAINNELIDDIDLATSLKPQEVKEKLLKKEIKVIDTGLSHGTVTAYVGQKKFEITTLREDVITDGRHAKVLFSSDWTKDAKRRDLTINAIYSSINGNIFDPFNGVSDLKNGKIRFIGSPNERIQEDYLRILRYFRFFSLYSKNNYDPDTIKSIKQNIGGLNKVSNERIFDELKKILSLKNLYNLFSLNQSKEIILNIFPQFKYWKRLEKTNFLNSKLRAKYDNGLILAALIVDHSDNYEYFCYKYKTSNNIRNRLKNISKNFENLKNNKFYSKENIKKLIYLSNKNSVKDLLFFSIFIKDKIETLSIEKLLDYVSTCEIPKFPISGDYLKKHGYETGKELGQKLKLLEEKWIENNFVLDKKTIEKSLNKINQN